MGSASGIDNPYNFIRARDGCGTVAAPDGSQSLDSVSRTGSPYTPLVRAGGNLVCTVRGL